MFQPRFAWHVTSELIQSKSKSFTCWSLFHIVVIALHADCREGPGYVTAVFPFLINIAYRLLVAVPLTTNLIQW